jgi:glycosyltransferase involved in cell wall biosynthesis
MKFLMFTPMLVESAIGRMSRLVAHALIAHGHEVVVVRAECERLLTRPAHAFETDFVLWMDEARVCQSVSECDAVIYHIGDNFEFHEGCLAWLSRVPGVVCIHDFFLGHLFQGWANTNRQEADAILTQWYGPDITERFFEFPDGQAFIDATKDAAPLTEWIASQATGIVTHSHWGVPPLRRACAGPIRVVPLAYDAPKAVAGSQAYVPNEYGRMKLLTIGHVNANKRASSVIRAIAGSEVLRRNLVYRLVGPIEPDTLLDLSALANSLRVNLMISGKVDDAALASALVEADAICCLRWPSLEAASASTVEAMLYGKATIVTDTGFYSEIPSDCVIKISQENELEDLRAALEHLYTTPHDRAAMADRGQRWAERSFQPARYARELVDIALASQHLRPVVSTRNYFLRMMKDWGSSGALLNSHGTISALNAVNELMSVHDSRGSIGDEQTLRLPTSMQR